MGTPRKIRLTQKTAKGEADVARDTLSASVRDSFRVLEATSDPLVITDSKDQIVFLNKQAEEYLCDGLSAPTTVYWAEYELLAADADPGRTPPEGMPEGRDSSRVRLRTEDASGNVRSINATVQSIEIERQHLKLIRLDKPAERKRLNLVRPDGEDRYRSVIQDFTELVCRWKPDGTLTFVNDAYCRYFGKDPEELIGQNFLQLIPESEHTKVWEHFESFTKETPVQTHEHRVLGADGELRWQRWTNRAIFDDYGRVVEFQSVGSNITEMKRVEEALQYRLELERIVMSLSSKFISITPDKFDDNIIEVLRTIGEFTKADRCYVFALSDDGATMSNTHEWCARGIIPHVDQLQNLPLSVFSHSLDVMRKGEVFHVPRVADLPASASAEKEEFEREGIRSLICVPMLRRGAFSGFVGFDSVHAEHEWTTDEIDLLKVVADVFATALEREHTERALIASEERYRLFAQNFLGVAFQATMDWIPTFFHGAVEAITGYSETDFLAGAPRWDEVIHPEDWPKIGDSARRMATQPNYSVQREYRIVHRNGEIRWVRERSQNICDNNGKPYLIQGTIYEVTEQRLAENALKDSEELNRITIDSMADAMHVVDRDLVFTLVNSKYRLWCRELGLDENVIGKTLFEVCPFLSSAVRDEYERVFSSGAALVTEESNHLRGEEIITETRKIPIRDGDGVKKVITVIRDITERKNSERALKESEQRFRTMADFTHDWEYWLGTDHRFVYVSPSCEATTGYKAEDFEADFELLRRMTHGDDLPILDRHLNEQVKPGKVSSIDFRIMTRLGDERWINHVCQPVYDEQGNYLGRRASNRDITVRKNVEEALRRERDRAQRYLDVAGTVLLALDGDEKVVLINRKGCDVLGLPEAEIVGRNWFDDFVPTHVREAGRRAFRRFATGHTGSSEYRESPVVTRTGEVRTIAWNDTLVRDDDGNIRGTLSSGSDITDRKRMERVQSALFEISEASNLTGSLEQLLQTIHGILGRLIDTTNFYVALYDAAKGQYSFPYIVDEYHDTADLAPEELRKTLTDYVRRTGLPLLADEERDRELIQNGEVAVVGQPSKIWLGVPLETSQGVIGVVAVQSYTDAALYKESDMDLMTFVSRHISMGIERKLAEEALRESEEHYRSLVETMTEGLVVRDNSNVITFVNQSFCDMLGYSTEEVEGSKLSRYLDNENLRVLTEQAVIRRDGLNESFELDWTRKDGTQVTTIMSPQPTRDASGRVTGCFAVVTDISDRKRAEDRLRQATNLLRVEREALTQKNIALKEILDHIEKERQDYKQAICKDVEQAMSPFLKKLRLFVDERRARELEGLETQMAAILAKDIDVFRDRYARLTPRELEICELIKAKLSSKEISERLNLSVLTVHKHREQIRRKLGITSKGINLSTYLQSH